MRLHIAIVTLPTGSFAEHIPGKNPDEQINELHQYVENAYKSLKANPTYHEGDTLLFVMPEFHSKGSVTLFQSHAAKKTLLNGYKLISAEFSDLLIMVNINSYTPKEKNDDEGTRLNHKSKIHKMNAVYALLNGVDILKHYKHNLGPADIPESEKTFFEHERKTYLEKKSKKASVPGLVQINGITIGIDICIDFAMSNLKHILENHYRDHFSAEKYGVDLHLVMSSSLDNALWRGTESNQTAGLVGKSHCFFVQADGNGQSMIRNKRSGIWMIDQEENSVKKLSARHEQIEENHEMTTYSINVNVSENIINHDIPNHHPFRLK